MREKNGHLMFFRLPKSFIALFCEMIISLVAKRTKKELEFPFGSKPSDKLSSRKMTLYQNSSGRPKIMSDH